MTQARSLLVPANAHGVYHCVSRCVRRAWLCGQDPLTGADHEHRRQWVEDRLAQLAELYAVSIWAYAVMSNHLHIVIEMHADVARDWGPDEVAVRWLGMYPAEAGQFEVAKAQIVANDARLAVLRARGKGSVARPREELVVHFPHYDLGSAPASALFLDDHKLVLHYEDDRCELYDLLLDPGERHDLARSEPQRTAELRRRLEAALRAIGAALPQANPAFGKDK